MKDRGQSKILTALLCVFFALVLSAAKTPVFAQTLAEQPHSLLFFYENVCASCHTEDEFYELFNRLVSPEEKEQITYEIRTYNVFLDANREVYEALLREDGKKKEDAALPVLAVDGEWLCGYEEMEQRLRGVLFGEETSGVPGERETAAAGDEVEAEDRAPDLPDDAQVILFFETYSCEDCGEVKEYLSRLQQDKEFAIWKKNVAKEDNVLLFKELLEIYGRTQEEGKVPAVFAGGEALLGKKEITERLPEILQKKAALYKEVKAQLAKTGGAQKEGTVSLPALFLAGLLAGVNPCAISMLLMLFSILLTTGASVWKQGALYLAGKYATYLGLGIGICYAASGLGEVFLGKFGTVVQSVIVCLFLAAAVMNLLDFSHVRKGEYGKVRMQLPKGLRRWNHKLLKKTGTLEGRLLGILVLGLGVAISLGEFFCSGQIYMASLLYVMREGQRELWRIAGTLIVYVTAMSIPSVLIVGVIARTKGTSRASDFMLKHMAAVKLLNAALFFAYAVWFVLRML